MTKPTLPETKSAAETSFDEAWYVAFYPDIAAAIARGDIRSGLDHFLKYGRQEGRFPSPDYREDGFDAVWYAASYPMAVREIQAGLASDYAEHYASRGRARG